MRNTQTLNLITLGLLSAFSTSLMADEAQTNEDKLMEEVTVVGMKVSYANNVTSESMLQQQSAMTSALSVVDNLPGVLINEGDTFGSDDWSTTVSIRGFQLSLDEQQVGITIDGIANGNSNYGGGAKANRYIDTENLQAVVVAQGTADISSRSNEALGGTLDFTTIDPTRDENLTLSYTTGNFDANKYFVRYNSGEVLGNSRAWVSLSSSENTDWVNQSAGNTHDHIAAKFISTFDKTNVTGYIAWDETHEDNYQRVTLEEFNQNPDWDRLTAEWTGVPYIDQLYRKGWSTLRENLFAYLEVSTNISGVELSANVYYHDNEGRGDWVPPYLVDVSDDGAGNPQSEVTTSNTTYGGNLLGQIFFVDASGNPVAPIAGCESSITFPYGGAGAQYDPQCYAQGALPVGSYRHTHYQKERLGFNADFNWQTQINNMTNTLRGGIWYEDYNRQESRDWHKIIDSKTGYEFNHIPYWVQYDREYPVETTMLYLEDNLDVGIVSARLGVKKFFVDLERQDNFGETADNSLNSDSDMLVSAGIMLALPVEGLEAYVGYAENFAAIKDEVLEREASTLENTKPETAENFDVGLRYSSSSINASLSYYSIDFENRLTFISPDSDEGIDYLVGTNGSFINTGGIQSSGFEAAMTYYPNNNWSIYASYTNNDSEYAGGSVGAPEGNTVYGSAEEMAVLSFDWQRNQYAAGLSSKWVGERWLDAANTQRLDAYLVSDFYAAINISSSMQGINDVQLRLTVNNLFDESYIGGVAGGWGGWIGAPRTAALNIKASF
ncbi:TonB-dependent receptor [Alteromonadaceae bacterium BrNp21-10]|nr:TonB-dependent receptor [Alteromonadaceae bacterium BrNp21-10]